MRFTPTSIVGAWLLDIEPIEDGRGFMARTFCRDQFADRGLRNVFVQCNLSFNTRRGTLRGLHFQAKPAEEAKVVSCISGAIYDVILDLRPSSPTFKQWASFELTSTNRRQLYIPEGVAHGFQTLEERSEVFYLMSAIYEPSLARGIRWNDPAFAILWPLAQPIMSDRDAAFQDFQP